MAPSGTSRGVPSRNPGRFRDRGVEQGLRGPLPCAPVTDDVRDIALDLMATGVSAAPGWTARTCLWTRKLRREQAFSGLPDNAGSLLVVNRDPAAAELAVHRSDVFALLEPSALIKDCGARVHMVTRDAVQRGFGERTEFCVGAPARTGGRRCAWRRCCRACGSTPIRGRARTGVPSGSASSATAWTPVSPSTSCWPADRG